MGRKNSAISPEWRTWVEGYARMDAADREKALGALNAEQRAEFERAWNVLESEKLPQDKKAKKLLSAAREHFQPGEEPEVTISGAYETKRFGQDSVRKGILVATNRRLFFYATKLAGYESESFPYNKISSLEMGKGLLGYHISFFASGNNVKVKWINSPDLPKLVETVRQHMESGSQTAAPAEKQTDDPMAQIEKLAKLRDAGAISEEEFESKKAELLSRI